MDKELTPEQEQAEKSVEVLQAYKRLFNSKDGMLVLNDLLGSCHFFSSSVAVNKVGDSNPHMTYFHEGQRDIVIRILSTLEKTPEFIRGLYTQRLGGNVHAHATYTANENAS